MLRSHPRLTYANVMSTIAVFAVLGGGAYAASIAPKNSVRSSSVKNGSLTGVDVKANSLTGANVDGSTLGTVPNATNAGHAANADALQGRPASDFLAAGGTAADSAKLGGLDAAAFATKGSEPWHELGPAQETCLPDGHFCGFGAGTCNWSNLSSNFSSGAYFRDAGGVVHLKGIVRFATGCGGIAIFKLPAGYRPAKNEVFGVASNNAFGAVYVYGPGDLFESSGSVRQQVGDSTTWVSLDGISFRCAPAGSDGCP